MSDEKSALSDTVRIAGGEGGAGGNRDEIALAMSGKKQVLKVRLTTSDTCAHFRLADTLGRQRHYGFFR